MADNAPGVEPADVVANEQANEQAPVDPAANAAAEVEGGGVNDVVQILEWIGFTPNQAIRIKDDLGRNLKALMGLNRRSVENTAESFAKRTVADGRIIFGTSRTNAVINAVRWAQDWQRLGTQPMLLPGTTEDGFLDELDQAAQRDKARKSALATADGRAKEASPGPLKGARAWESWFEKLQNQLSIMMGVLQVPLIYVIRDSVPHLVEEKAKAQARRDGSAEPLTYDMECILDHPHRGEFFKKDSEVVHRLIWAYCLGQETQHHIKEHKSKMCGKRDIAALCAYFAGAGNQTRPISDAEHLRDTLNYRTEASMPFESFLSKTKNMFNLFEEAGEGYTPHGKLRFLLEKCKDAAALSTLLAAIEATVAVKPDEYTFDTASSALSTKIKARTGRSLSAVGAEEAVPDRSVILNKDGSINANYRADFHSLHSKLKKEIYDERERLGIGSGNGKGKGKGKGKWKGKRNAASLSSKVSNQSTEIKRLNAKIAAMSVEGGNGSSEDSPDDAGNSFGGRAEMAESKKKKRKTN